ncbi:hypothetical protein BBJ29_003315 [Phytophthora kernoviae]|uniref:C2 domain-containing protein n=1 Tax=Phytophthora kernoviae TaxID=325452 RepID=A0A3F2RWV6_9STRA|nr:hypothetical protein BBJ29_003315 [Phytophthora kernoviae]RLN65803.1 hypothetical protein BBP00_00002616 [Phytophthora kernoviae]
MDVAYERPASTSSYFARPPPASRLLLRVYSAEGLRHVSNHGTYCKIYVGSTDMKGKSLNPMWNEKFDIPVLDPEEDVLSIRVKSARLMSSPAIGACSIPLKYLTMQGATTVDRWVDLKRGKKEAGRLRLQLRLVDPSATRIQNQQPQDDQDRPSSPRPRDHQNSDTYLSLPTDDSSDESFKKTSRRDHKYHRSARRFDGALSSTATSTIDARDSSRVHVNFSDSDSDDEDEVSSEKSREQQRQQWQMQQRKMQLREVKEVDSESESVSEDVDEFDDELELETPRMQITPTLATLLSRQSMNVLFDEEEDTDDELEALKMSDEFVPILEATSPASIDSIDSALRESSFD